MFDNLSNQNGIHLDSDMIHPVLHQHKSDDFSPSLAASFPSGRPGPLLGLFVEEPRQRSYGGGRENPVFVGEEKTVYLATINNRNCVVVSNIYYVHPYLGK